MQLQHLTQKDVDLVTNACRIREAEYVTLASGVVQRTSSSTNATYQQADQGVLNALSDEAFIELQALAWVGRGDSGADLQTNLGYSAKRFDDASREYLYEKSPLRKYIEEGLKNSGAKLKS